MDRDISLPCNLRRVVRGFRSAAALCFRVAPFGTDAWCAAPDGEVPSVKTSVARLGSWWAIVAFSAAAGYDLVQILQFAGVVTHPWDEILIYAFSWLIATPFLLAFIALHLLA